MGKRDLIFISNMSRIQHKPSIKVMYTKHLGMAVHEFDYDLDHKNKLPAYSFENSSHYLDELIIQLEIFFRNLIDSAEKEDIFLKVVDNIKRVNRRINGLKNMIIPNLILDIKKIREILEENDRENFVRLKKTKDLIQKKEIKKKTRQYNDS